jgi:hypothetical protein
MLQLLDLWGKNPKYSWNGGAQWAMKPVLVFLEKGSLLVLLEKKPAHHSAHGLVTIQIKYAGTV